MNTDEIPESGGSSIELWLSGSEERAAEIALQTGVWDAFRREPLLEDAALEVEVADGVATLQGVVDNARIRVTAARAAERVKGIRRVENRIEVRRSQADFHS